jgi:two-component system OmpR family response regulator
MTRHAEPVSADDTPRVLIVEDDLKLGRTLVRGLREAGFTVEMAPSGEAGLGALAERPADVVMLDVVLPGIDGFETCRRLRAHDARTPVVMLSARGGVSDRVAGLDVGADDYLAKPFSFLELVARLRALVRRGERRRADPIEVGPLRVDPAARKAWREDAELDLTAREFDLLEALARRAGDVVSRDWLLEQAWDIAYQQRSNVVDAYVRLLRGKLDRPFTTPMLHTVRGAGYRLEAPA